MTHPLKMTTSRRSINSAALWSAPALVIGAAAPTFAASNDPKNFHANSLVSLNRYYNSWNRQTTVNFTISSNLIDYKLNNKGKLSIVKTTPRPAVSFSNLNESDAVTEIEITYLLPSNSSYYNGGFSFKPNSSPYNYWSPLTAGTPIQAGSKDWWGQESDRGTYVPYTTTYSGPIVRGPSSESNPAFVRAYTFEAEQKTVKGNSNETNMHYYFRIAVKINGNWQYRYGGTDKPPAIAIPFYS
ncbi:hypothetical protein [Actinomyces vulturis]|uniref:hypothetical protein n=1 Tax=Actinomyces vulturis TaxID=1857645 RepID=UPI00114774D8|nr:hypothetical protein [Actinomyces vulturis]